MSSAKLIRRSGLASMLGSVLWTVLELLSNSAWDRTIFGLTYEDYNRLKPMALLLLLVGLVGFYARQGRHSGRLGRTGFGVAFLGLSLLLVGNVVEFWIGGGIRFGDKAISTLGWNIVLVGVPLLALGMVLLGTATLRLKVFSGWMRATPLLIVLLPASVALFTLAIRSVFTAEEIRRALGEWGMALSVVAFGVGWAVLGYGLWSEKTTQTIRDVI